MFSDARASKKAQAPFAAIGSVLGRTAPTHVPRARSAKRRDGSGHRRTGGRRTPSRALAILVQQRGAQQQPLEPLRLPAPLGRLPWNLAKDEFGKVGNDAAQLQIDSRPVAASPAPKPQVCGMVGNMVQLATASLGLKSGRHAVHIEMTHSTGPDGFAVEWQGPGMPLTGLGLAPPN